VWSFICKSPIHLGTEVSLPYGMYNENLANSEQTHPPTQYLDMCVEFQFTHN
jgi:hypothetical protein